MKKMLSFVAIALMSASAMAADVKDVKPAVAAAPVKAEATLAKVEAPVAVVGKKVKAKTKAKAAKADVKADDKVEAKADVKAAATK